LPLSTPNAATRRENLIDCRASRVPTRHLRRRHTVRVLPWDHNAFYHPLLLDLVPDGAERVLEVGCGAGHLATQLAARAAHVDAIDSDARMIGIARRRTPANVTCSVADVMTAPLPEGCYDAVLSLAVLHHLPLRPALERFAAALKPGGTLAAIGVPERDYLASC
jgi:2-polyprenyl-3-methyl-5-hydroxy-6-metoxy-1,4-benzoquinol methylase